MSTISAVIVGIGDYQYSEELHDVQQLKYCVSDADAIQSYFELCRSKETHITIERVKQEKANFTEIEKAFDRLSLVGSLDLLVVYFSGHGIISDSHKGLLIQPQCNCPDKLDLLTPSDISEFLSSIPSTKTLLVVDCCFAEAILADIDFFSTLHESSSYSRIYIGSARAKQRAWEVDQISQSVFTAHLSELLHAGEKIVSLKSKSVIDVEGELFPFLQTHVPLYTLEHKAQTQEPIKSGTVLAPILLPIAGRDASLRTQTPLQTALSRIRQIGLSLAAAVFILLIGAYGLVYHFELDARDEVVLRAGPKWAQPVLRFLPNTRLRTGIHEGDISNEITLRYPIVTGQLSGFWTHRSSAGTKAWFDQLYPHLAPDSQFRTQALMGDRAAVESLIDENNITAHQFENIAWAMMSIPKLMGVEKLLASLPASDRISELPEAVDRNLMDFSVIDLDIVAIESLGRGLGYLSLNNPEVVMPYVIKFIKMIEEWRVMRPTKVAFAHRAVSAGFYSLDMVMSTRTERGLPAIDDLELATIFELADKFDNRAAAYALTNIELNQQHFRFIASALSKFDGTDSTSEQEFILSWARDLLNGTELAKEIVNSIFNSFNSNDNLNSSTLIKFLVDAGNANSIPDSVSRHYTDKLKGLVGIETLDGDYDQITRVLAANFANIDDESTSRLYALIKRIANESPLSASLLTEIFGHLAEGLNDKPYMIRHVEKYATLAADEIVQQREPINRGSPGVTIVFDSSVWLYSLADFASARELSMQSVDLLLHVAKNTSSKTLKRYIIFSVARQRTHFLGDDIDLADYRKLIKPSRSSIHRLINVQQLNTQLAELPYMSYLEAIEKLMYVRNNTVEPEIRMAIGSVIVGSQIDRAKFRN